MDLELFNNLIVNEKEREAMQKFIGKLSDFIKDNAKSNETAKYNQYWEYQNFFEDNVAANIGISRYGADVRYRNNLSDAVNNAILKLSETEGTLYRKKFMPNGPKDKATYSVDKFENGKVEHLVLDVNQVPKGYDNSDIIFQCKSDGSIVVRLDLKEKIVNFASESTKDLKLEETKKAEDYKREGHVYKAIEDDGYIFLKDLTEKREFVFEDIDFVVDSYKGDGNYQVINGKYEKISE